MVSWLLINMGSSFNTFAGTRRVSTKSTRYQSIPALTAALKPDLRPIVTAARVSYNDNSRKIIGKYIHSWKERARIRHMAVGTWWSWSAVWFEFLHYASQRSCWTVRGSSEKMKILFTGWSAFYRWMPKIVLLTTPFMFLIELMLQDLFRSLNFWKYLFLLATVTLP